MSVGNRGSFVVDSAKCDETMCGAIWTKWLSESLFRSLRVLKEHSGEVFGVPECVRVRA